nr:hypothetical protein [Leclercia adecarboxylata]
MRPIAQFSQYYYNEIGSIKEQPMHKQPMSSFVTKEQIYRAVASSTAIETGAPVQKIEQQLKRNQALAKAVGLAR